jgi:hypothetical protein
MKKQVGTALKQCGLPLEEKNRLQHDKEECSKMIHTLKKEIKKLDEDLGIKKKN